ncbi:DUF6783 domain-containing protein [Robinsoniella peoriensis]
MRDKSPTKCDAQLPESNFETPFRIHCQSKSYL